MTRHVSESELALYATGDLRLGGRLMARLHMTQCPRCRARVQLYLSDRKQVRDAAGRMPEGVNWNRLAAEMTANIRVGLAAGECVAPRTQKAAFKGWRPAAAVTGLAVLLATGWWLNMPRAETQALGRVARVLMRGHGGIALEEQGPTVEATAAGIELRENGGSMGMSQGSAQPVAVSLSVQGSARAHYVDAETGQVTITSVYVQ